MVPKEFLIPQILVVSEHNSKFGILILQIMPFLERQEQVIDLILISQHHFLILLRLAPRPIRAPLDIHLPMLVIFLDFTSFSQIQ